jgi:hypothetical protein
MSLEALPTELDTRIIEHLHDTEDRQALCALSLVSRCYSALAGSFLYRTIAINDKVEVCVKRLMMTLLDWNKFTHHIRSIAVSAPVHTDTSPTEFEDVTYALRRYIVRADRVIRDVDLDKKEFNKCERSFDRNSCLGYQRRVRLSHYVAQ